MGADRVQCFDKGIADRVLAMDRQALEAFVSDNLGLLRSRNVYGSVLVHVIDEEQRSVSEAIDILLADVPGRPAAEAFAELRVDVALDAAFSGDQMVVDYWGCYVETLMSAKGMLSCIDYLGWKEEDFLLLGPEHVDLMLASLDRHASELTIMRPEHVALLRRWRDDCAANASHRVAYFLG